MASPPAGWSGWRETTMELGSAVPLAGLVLEPSSAAISVAHWGGVAVCRYQMVGTGGGRQSDQCEYRGARVNSSGERERLAPPLGFRSLTSNAALGRFWCPSHTQRPARGPQGATKERHDGVPGGVLRNCSRCSLLHPDPPTCASLTARQASSRRGKTLLRERIVDELHRALGTSKGRCLMIRRCIGATDEPRQCRSVVRASPEPTAMAGPPGKTAACNWRADLQCGHHIAHCTSPGHTHPAPLHTHAPPPTHHPLPPAACPAARQRPSRRQQQHAAMAAKGKGLREQACVAAACCAVAHLAIGSHRPHRIACRRT